MSEHCTFEFNNCALHHTAAVLIAGHRVSHNGPAWDVDSPGITGQVFTLNGTTLSSTHTTPIFKLNPSLTTASLTIATKILLTQQNKHTYIYTYIQTDKHTDKQTNIQTQTCLRIYCAIVFLQPSQIRNLSGGVNTYRQTNIQTNKHTNIYKQPYIRTYVQTHIQKHIHTYIHTDKHTTNCQNTHNH